MKLLLIAICISIISCKRSEDPGPLIAPAKNEMNVSYGVNSAQKMDIYLPSGRTESATKVVVLIHGGGWATGDKADFDPYIDTLKKRLPGYAIFNINYRLAAGTNNLFPTQENDVKSAIEFIYNKKQEYQVSDKFVLLGLSAGSHLSLLHAYKYTSPVKIKAVVDFFGPTDLVDMYNNPASPLAPSSAVSGVVGATPASNPTIYQESSPINYVTATSSPTIILHGGMDPLVAVSQATSLKAKLDLMNVPNQYVFYPSESHGWFGAPLSDSFDKIAAFLSIHVN